MKAAANRADKTTTAATRELTWCSHAKSQPKDELRSWAYTFIMVRAAASQEWRWAGLIPASLTAISWRSYRKGDVRSQAAAEFQKLQVGSFVKCRAIDLRTTGQLYICALPRE